MVFVLVLVDLLTLTWLWLRPIFNLHTTRNTERTGRLHLWGTVAFTPDSQDSSPFAQCLLTRHITTQHNTTRHITTQHNTTQHNTTRHITTQHNTTWHVAFLCKLFYNREPHQGELAICYWWSRHSRVMYISYLIFCLLSSISHSLKCLDLFLLMFVLVPMLIIF